MNNKLTWVVFLAITLVILGVFVFAKQSDQAGDIIEYFGVTESIKNHGAIWLSEVDKDNLSRALSPGYFNDPGYYITGVDGKRYPVHFFAYSLLLLPIRAVFHVLHINELNTLRTTNVIILMITLFMIMKFFVKDTFKRYALLILVFLSPLLWFLVWPGPDIYYLCLLLLAIFLFYQEKLLLSSLCLVLASWHSQPLVAISFLSIGYYLAKKNQRLLFPARSIAAALVLIGLILIPYLYNYLAFGVLSPWTIFKDGWTQLNGFGIQNASFQKLFEQFFDLNIGLFWYAPVLFIGGILFFAKAVRESRKKSIAVGIAVFLTCFLYQTNPAWHYGTSGYGPTRHILFIIPFLIYYMVTYLEPKLLHIALLVSFIVFQIPNIYMQNFLFPNFEKTHYHTPLALLVLNKYPGLYNPTPEIFVDRTNHTDLKIPTSTIYKDKGVCKKVYILLDEKDMLIKECGEIPEKYAPLFEDMFHRKASYSRTLTTTSVTFWPDPGSCAGDYFPSKNHPFICMKTKEDVVQYTGIKDEERIGTVEGFETPGVWKIATGEPIEITIPPGYITDYKAFKGVYVNFQI